MKLALWQACPENGNIEAGFSSICQMITAASAAGADILLAPELILPGYNQPELHARAAQSIDGAWITGLRAAAREAGIAVCFGWAEREGEQVYNAATTISATGEILAHYRKVQLFGPMERASFSAGAHLCPIFDLCGRRAAMQICYDIEFPGHTAALAKAGADPILVPTANPAGYEHVQSLLVPARAHEANVVVAYANFAGEDGDLTFGGRSLIAGPDGEALASAGPRGAALLVVDLAAADAVPELQRSRQAVDYRPVGFAAGEDPQL